MFGQITKILLIFVFLFSAVNLQGCWNEHESSNISLKSANPAMISRQSYLNAIKTAFEAGPETDQLAGSYLGNTEFVYIARGGLFTIQWPETAQIAFYAWGPSANSYLMKITSQSRDANEIAAAMEILAINQYRPAIESLRTQTRSNDPKIRNSAVQCLAMFAQQQDRQKFIKGLQSDDSGYRAACIEALTLYRDPNITPLIAPFLDHNDPLTSETALGSLMMLPCTQSYAAVKNALDNTENRKFRDVYGQAIREFCDYLGTEPEQYDKLSDAGKQRLYDIAKERAQQPFVLKADEKMYSKTEIKQILSEMSREKTLTLSQYPELREAHFIAVLEIDDIELLLNLRAAIGSKLGQSALEDYRTLAEIDEINEIIRRIAQNQPKQTE